MSDFTASVDTPVAFMHESSNNTDKPSSYSPTDTSTSSSSTFAKWSPEETAEIAVVRQRLGALLTDRPQYPDVVGDRKIVRYLRGHEHDLDKVVDFMRNTLKWRDDNKIDTVVRHDILHKGLDHPSKFPFGDILTKLIPGISIHHKALDKFGCPVCVDTYNFSPGAVLGAVSQDDYVQFMIYVFEYRSLILEQMSDAYERAALDKLVSEGRDPKSTPPYGVMLQTCVIRDLSGIGFEFMGASGKALLKSVVSIASNNYPETLRKSFMIKTPWLFNTLWYFIKGFITTRTVNKVSILGWSYQDELLGEVAANQLPAMVGGQLSDEPGPFAFDTSYLDNVN